MVRRPVSIAVSVRFPNRKVHREQSQVRQQVRQNLARPRYADRSAAGRGGQDFGGAQHAAGRDYHLLLDQQSDDIFATTDQLAERVRKLGGTTLRSIGQIGKLQTINDNNESYVPPREMLRELMEDNKHVAAAMRKAHKLCDDHEDSGTAGLLETFIDETERRTWFLFEASRQEGANAA
jgi:DNA-binding ferritin-like protein